MVKTTKVPTFAQAWFCVKPLQILTLSSALNVSDITLALHMLLRNTLTIELISCLYLHHFVEKS
jgi:hypothetical protein